MCRRSTLLTLSPVQGIESRVVFMEKRRRERRGSDGREEKERLVYDSCIDNARTSTNTNTNTSKHSNSNSNKQSNKHLPSLLKGLSGKSPMGSSSGAISGGSDWPVSRKRFASWLSL